MKKFQSVLFDFDGTLIDSWPAIYSAYVEAFNYFYPYQDSSHIAKLRYSHNNYYETYKTVFKMDNVSEEMIHFTEAVYSRIVVNQTKLFEGVENILNFIDDQNIPWGIVTTKKKNFVNILIKGMHALKNHKALICYEDVVNKKPHPEGLIKACKIMDVDPSHSIYIGDTLDDINAAKNCSMPSAHVKYGYAPDFNKIKESGVSFYLDKITDLKPIIS